MMQAESRRCGSVPLDLAPRERRATSHQRRQALAALELNLERAPDEMVRAVVDWLTERTIKYGSLD